MAATAEAGTIPGGIGQIALTVRDVERATVFYRDRLGLEFLFSAPPDLAFFRCGEVRLMLSQGEPGEQDHPTTLLYYDVEDIDAAHRRLAAEEVAVVREPEVIHRTDDTELRIGFYRDGEGNTFGLMNEGPAGKGQAGR